MTAMRTRQPQTPPPRGPVEPDRLMAVLGRLEDEHTQLLGLAKAHKDALAHASLERMREITTRTSEVLTRIARIDQERQRMSADDRGAIATLDDLLERFGDEDRSRLGERCARLRELILRVRDEQEAVRIASENLANHMRGLMKQVSASLSHAGTYSRAGAVDPSRSQVVSSLDMVR